MDEAERKRFPREIFQSHVSPQSDCQINLDSITLEAMYEDLDMAQPDLFVRGQEHIYKLMKFDSFARFKKSDLYRKHFMAEMDGEPLPDCTP